MKLSIAILFSTIVAIQGAAIQPADLQEPEASIFDLTSLFASAWTYQDRLQELQTEINVVLTEIRTSVSSALKISSRLTLQQIESNTNTILAIDKPARDEIFGLRSSSACVINLKTLINGVTEFSGFGSSNCVTDYDKSVQGVLNNAYAFLQKFEGTYGDIQQYVVRAFIGKNAYTQPEEIEALFATQFNNAVTKWDAAKPEAETFLSTLNTNIAVFNGVLGECFTGIQTRITPYYSTLQTEIATCAAFDSTPDPFTIFRQ